MKRRRFLELCTMLAAMVAGLPLGVMGQELQPLQRGNLPTALTPPPSSIGTMPELITQFSADLRTTQRRFRIAIDPIRRAFYENVLASWRTKIDGIDFQKLDTDSRLDWLMLSREIDHLQFVHQREKLRDDGALKWVPYANLLVRYCASKDHGEPLDAESAAALLSEVTLAAELAERELPKARVPAKADTANNAEDAATKRLEIEDAIAAVRASELIDQLLRFSRDTHRYYDGYDPKYMWWSSKPFDAAIAAIQKHRVQLRDRIAGISEKDNEKIVGLPIGEPALKEAIHHAWIPYTAEELIAIGEREFAWCEEEFRKAADELGCKGDWRQALELVKARHVDPGEQPKLIRELAWEAIRFLEANDLLTVPDLAKHGWRLEMMSPEAQKVNPYFLGGENIIVSFPTNTMTHTEKLMSLKSNNIHFCRATVHHELIPGHHLQTYTLARYRPYRDLFDSPFWMEGWALYWEMLLWDLQFAQSPEDRVGMLFWRKHRAARIIFSLNYQAGKWTAEECVAYLIDKVGHEPSAAAAEVRRSIMGGYGPLYQAGYMLGGLQLRSLHREIVQAGKMTNKQFHDAVLQESFMPFELLRLKLLKLPVEKGQQPVWRF